MYKDNLEYIVKFSGWWEDDRKHHGEYYYFGSGEKYFDWNFKEEKNMGKYNGHLENDKRHGHGIFYYPNGEKYDGEWKDDAKHGRGILYDKNGFIKQKGMWESDVFVLSNFAQEIAEKSIKIK